MSSWLAGPCPTSTSLPITLPCVSVLPHLFSPSPPSQTLTLALSTPLRGPPTVLSLPLSVCLSASLSLPPFLSAFSVSSPSVFCPFCMSLPHSGSLFILLSFWFCLSLSFYLSLFLVFVTVHLAGFQHTLPLSPHTSAYPFRPWPSHRHLPPWADKANHVIGPAQTWSSRRQHCLGLYTWAKPSDPLISSPSDYRDCSAVTP